MIKFKVELDKQQYDIELDENLNMTNAFEMLFNKKFHYGYIARYQHVDKFNQTFKEAGILNGETIRIIT